MVSAEGVAVARLVRVRPPNPAAVMPGTSAVGSSSRPAAGMTKVMGK